MSSLLTKCILLNNCRRSIIRPVLRGEVVPRCIIRNYVAQPPKREKKEGFAIVFSWRTLFVTVGIGGVLVAFVMYLRNEKDKQIAKERNRVLGKAAIGGRFELINQDEKPMSSEDLFGKWVMIYFGFTHCPDVCPEEMEKLAEITNILDKEMPGVPFQPLFISVDPERDNASAVKKYIAEFSPRFIGLTGSKEQIDKTCKAFRVYYSAGPKDVTTDYIVDHTIIMYLINPKGQFLDYYGQNKTAREITNTIMYFMSQYNEENKKGWMNNLFSSSTSEQVA